MFQAITKKAQELGLGMWLRRAAFFRYILRLCCTLALLPSDLIPYGFYEIAYECSQRGLFVYNQFYPLLQYLETRWVNDPLRRRTMSVFGCEHRTNNISESLNRYMRAEVGAHHPNIYALFGKWIWWYRKIFFTFPYFHHIIMPCFFIFSLHPKECLSRLEGISYASLLALEEGRNPTRPRPVSSVWNDLRLQRLARVLQVQPFGFRHAIRVYMHQASYSVRNAFNMLIGLEEEDELI